MAFASAPTAPRFEHRTDADPVLGLGFADLLQLAQPDASLDRSPHEAPLALAVSSPERSR